MVTNLPRVPTRDSNLISKTSGATDNLVGEGCSIGRARSQKMEENLRLCPRNMKRETDGQTNHIGGVTGEPRYRERQKKIPAPNKSVFGRGGGRASLYGQSNSQAGECPETGTLKLTSEGRGHERKGRRGKSWGEKS